VEKAPFGRTGLEVSRLTFGCGAVGGLMTRGAARDQDRAIAWARDHGINFFDTAASYGNGASETNLGRALGGNTDGIIVSTKVGVAKSDFTDIGAAVQRSLDASLGRLQLDHVDIFQLHNTLDTSGSEGTMPAEQALEEVVPAFEKLRAAGKTRFLGFTAKGESDQLHQLVDSGCFDSAQIFYNLLVPTASESMPPGYPSEDYRQLLEAAARAGVGSIGVRVLAGGALSGSMARHPIGLPLVEPIGSNTDYATDVERARQFMPLLETGAAQSLTELAIRYAISHRSLSTTEIGIATIEELQDAAAAINRGPLPHDALERIRAIQTGFANAK